MSIPELYKIYQQFPSVQIDTRKLKQGDMFFALKGPNFNGNLFAEQALAAGASYVVSDEKTAFESDKIIYVKDSLKALQDLAKHHREQFKIPFIAITGTNGKTTTKELIHAVLSSTYKTYTTQGNLNNHIGVPLTILSIKKDAEMAVIEMGANHIGEIAGYCEYAKPDFGIINNVGRAHLEGFGSVEGVKKAKGELYDYIRKTNGHIFINESLDYLLQMSKGIHNCTGYGGLNSKVRGTASVTHHNFLKVLCRIDDLYRIDINTKLIGTYNLPNVECAVAIGHYFKIQPDVIRKALENYTPSNSRSQLVVKNGNRIILDAYNANPSSVKAAIENFAAIHSDNKLIMLGAMKELGDDSIEEHESVVAQLENFEIKNVLLVGGDFANVKHNFTYVRTNTEAKEWFEKQNITNADILIKGSRGIGMEKIIE